MAVTALCVLAAVSVALMIAGLGIQINCSRRHEERLERLIDLHENPGSRMEERLNAPIAHEESSQPGEPSPGRPSLRHRVRAFNSRYRGLNYSEEGS